MKLVVGLGNPGKEYKETRHNVGFMVLDNYLGHVNWKTKLDSYFYSTEINNEQVIFIKPNTYMNLSGIAVKKVAKFYKINPSDILVIQDDLDMSLGSFKVKRNSSSGGHNGIKSIIGELGTEEFGRLKIGIDKDQRIPVDKYVLTKFPTYELEKITENYDAFNRIIDLFINEGIEKTISLYNNN